MFQFLFSRRPQQQLNRIQNVRNLRLSQLPDPQDPEGDHRLPDYRGYDSAGKHCLTLKLDLLCCCCC